MASAVNAHAEGSVTIGVADGRSTYLVEHTHPGATVERHLRVGNTTPDPLAVDVYTGAASNAAGKFTWREGRTPNELTRWTTVRPDRVRVPSQRAVEVTVRIHVPDGTPLGEHYAVVWAELPRSDTGVVNRVGMRIYLTVTKRTDSNTGLIVAIVALVLLALALSATALAVRRRGSAREDSTTANP